MAQLEKINRSSPDLERWTPDADGDLLLGPDDCLAVTQDLQAVLEEGRLDRNEVLKVGEGDGTFQKLPPDVVGVVREDELVGVRHEAVLVEFIADILCRDL